MTFDPQQLVSLTDHGTMTLRSAVARAMTLPFKERMRATIVREGKPKVLRFEQIKDLAVRWEKQLQPSEWGPRAALWCDDFWGRGAAQHGDTCFDPALGCLIIVNVSCVTFQSERSPRFQAWLRWPSRSAQNYREQHGKAHVVVAEKSIAIVQNLAVTEAQHAREGVSMPGILSALWSRPSPRRRARAVQAMATMRRSAPEAETGACCSHASRRSHLTKWGKLLD
jgi:hypothetical protein